MQNSFSYQLNILPSLCDHHGQLSVPAAFDIFMDLATAHANRLGVGIQDMSPQNLFWIAVKTKICIHEIPQMGDTIDAFTFPQKPGRIHCTRQYSISQDGNKLITGKTEWAVLNTETNNLQKPETVFPMDLDFLDDSGVTAPFARILDNFTEEHYASYTVRSTDIDIGQHMNNVSYIRMIVGSFSSTDWDSLNVHQFDVMYKSPCFEGDVLKLQKRKPIDGGLEIRVSNAETDKTVLLAKIQ